ncbi:MAG: hypothetical protein NXI23_01870 [Bacteroidetes bacterium]|jgi:hypothetical protein|nr:hypothetical protein [Bacteroidota bacterium]MDF1864216.1 hypothetical protein [Saprospiraceae bacterium]
MFKKGVVVKVKKGVKIDSISINIEGWHGRIGKSQYNDPDMVLVELDSVVLKSLPDEYIIETLRITDIDTFNHFYLGKDDIEVSEVRDTLTEVEATLEEISNKFFWKSMSDGSPEEELLQEL